MPQQTDKLIAEFELRNLPKVLAGVDSYKNALKSAKAEVDSVGTGTSFAGKLDAQLAKATARHKQFTDSIKKQNADAAASDAKLGTAIGAFAGTLIGGSIGTALIAGGKAALSAAKDADDANRVLRASAIETGLAYDKLAASAEAFGKRTALSNTDAQRTFAQLVNFANAAGRTDKLDEFTKKFSDLAAAKGINASQLGDISRQLNALTDEATDKLLNANPSAFYDKFARSLNKTAEQLTDTEKRAAVFDEVLKKGAIFDGQAAARTNSFAGEVDSLKKEFDDLTASVGKALVPVTRFVLSAGQVDRKLFISDEERAEINRQAKELGEIRAKAAAESLRASDKEIADARKNDRSSLRNFALSNLTDAQLSQTFFDPTAREKIIQTAVANATTFRDDLKKRLENSLKAGGDQRFARAEFIKNINLFDAETRDRFVNDFSSNYAEGLRKILQKVRVTVPELRKGLSDALKTSNLTSKDRESVAKDFTDAILSQINAGRSRVADLGKQTDALFAGLFAKKGESNPFVTVFTEAEKAIESTRIATAGLSEDLRKQADQLVATNNANALFSARLETRLKAVDLRSDAEAIRNGGGETDEQFGARLDKELKLRGFNPDDFKRFSDAQKSRFLAIQQSRSFIDRASDEFNTDLRKRDGLFGREADFSNFIRTGLTPADNNPLQSTQNRFTQAPGFDVATARLNGVSIESLIQGSIENFRQKDNLSAGDRLERQLAVIRGLGPTNDAQRAEADRKIIALTQGINFKDLTESQRNAAAAARENEATRLENAEAAAKAERKEAAETQKSIDENIKKLLKLAETEGLQGVIRIINDAEDKAAVSVGKRPTPRDVTSLSDL